MSREDALFTLEDQIDETSENLDQFIETFIEENQSLNPLTTTTFDSFSKYLPQIQEKILTRNPELSSFTDTSSHLISELSFTRKLSDYLNYTSVENNDTYHQIGVLIDLSFYLKLNSLSQYDLPLILTQTLFKTCSAEWLLKFWSYIELRLSHYKHTKENEVLLPIKSSGIPFMISINLLLKRLHLNNELKRDILRAKLLHLIDSVFPLFDKLLINKKFEVNKERSKENRYKRSITNTNFNTFWRIQEFLSDPFEYFDNTPSRKALDIHKDLERVFNLIYDAEDKENGPFNKLNKEPEANNSIEVYEKRELTDSKRLELKEYYQNRDFNPSFFINESKFQEQIAKDRFLRRTYLLQIYIVSGFLDNVFAHLNLKNGNVKNQPTKLINLKSKLSKSHAIFFVNLKKDTQHLFQALEKRIFFVNLQLRDFTEYYTISKKIQFFKDFNKEFESFAINDELLQSIIKRQSYKPKYWAAYGTPQITKHFKIQTGLSGLEKSETYGTITDVDARIQVLRNRLDEFDADADAKELTNWKALRLARKTNLFKFKHVSLKTGLEGLFDPSLKIKLDEDRKLELENLKLEKELKAKQDEELKVKEEEEEEKKRKASQDLFEEESKRAKLESAHSNSNEVLDY